MVCSLAPDPRTNILTRLPYRPLLASVRPVGAKRIKEEEGQLALQAWAAGPVPRETLALAVRYALQTLRSVAPGTSVEIRVPPFAAVQAIPGPTHTRGTPPAVVEMAPEVCLELVTGRRSFHDAVSNGLISASGERSDLSRWLPVLEIP